MNYINSKQFLEQPKEVQEVFLKWWQPKQFDVRYHLQSQSYGVNKSSYKSDLEFIEKFKGISYIPCFSETQLRQFIEEKIGYKILVIPYWGDDDIFHYHIKFKDMGIGGHLLHEPNYYASTDDLLQAYWKVACEIAKEVK